MTESMPTPPPVEDADLRHLPPPGSIVRHYSTEALYRRICDTSFPSIGGGVVLRARLATNGATHPYRLVNVYANSSGLTTDLGYRAVVYCALAGGVLYIREHNEFHGLVNVAEPSESQRLVARFQELK